MIEDFKRVLANFEIMRILDSTVAFDPVFTTVCYREGWRSMKQGNDCSQESWRCSLTELVGAIVAKVTEQLKKQFPNSPGFSPLIWYILATLREKGCHCNGTKMADRGTLGAISIC